MNAHKKEDGLAGMPSGRLLARRRELAGRLGDVEHVLAGSLAGQSRGCGKAGCQCADGEPPGPYAYFSPRPAGAGRAREWPAAQGEAGRRCLHRGEEVVDRELGVGGTSAGHRAGFRELMSRVCLGEVGAVIGLEVSRLARSNADLARLAEMARLTGTLLIDSDGVYDLSDFNDWLVLGLKSTMSQAQLHILAGPLPAPPRPPPPRARPRAPPPPGLASSDEGDGG